MRGWLEEVGLDFLDGSPAAAGWHYAVGCEACGRAFTTLQLVLGPSGEPGSLGCKDRSTLGLALPDKAEWAGLTGQPSCALLNYQCLSVNHSLIEILGEIEDGLSAMMLFAILVLDCRGRVQEGLGEMDVGIRYFGLKSESAALWLWLHGLSFTCTSTLSSVK